MEKIGLLGDFTNAEAESKFRDDSLDSVRRLVIGAAGIVIFAAVTFLANDYAPTGLDMNAAAPRILVCIISIICLLLGLYAKTRNGVYASALFLAASVATLNTIIAYSRPPDFLLHIGIDVLIIIGIYLIVPTVKLQLLLGLSLSTALVALHFTQKLPPHPIAHVTIPMTLVVANILGLTASAIYNRTRHQLYAQFEELRNTKTRVEALSELVPICAKCKMIRNDAGYWEQVETYMQETAGKQVTHGLCPACVKEMQEESEIG